MDFYFGLPVLGRPSPFQVEKKCWPSKMVCIIYHDHPTPSNPCKAKQREQRAGKKFKDITELISADTSQPVITDIKLMLKVLYLGSQFDINKCFRKIDFTMATIKRKLKHEPVKFELYANQNQI